MTKKEKAEQKTNCIYAAVNILGMNNASSALPLKPRPTTEEVLVEAKEIWAWVSAEKGDDK